MGRVKELLQEERDKRWQEHYAEFMESFDGVSGVTTVDAAEQYADDMMEEEDNDLDRE